MMIKFTIFILPFGAILFTNILKYLYNPIVTKRTKFSYVFFGEKQLSIDFFVSSLVILISKITELLNKLEVGTNCTTENIIYKKLWSICLFLILIFVTELTLFTVELWNQRQKVERRKKWLFEDVNLVFSFIVLITSSIINLN